MHSPRGRKSVVHELCRRRQRRKVWPEATQGTKWLEVADLVDPRGISAAATTTRV